MSQPVTAATAHRVLELFATAISAMTGEHCPTGEQALRQGSGPMVTDPAVNDTTGYGHWTVIMEGGPVDEISNWHLMAAVQAAIDTEGLNAWLEPYAGWAVTIYPAN